MKTQRYTLYGDEGEYSHALMGQFVHADNESDVVIGYVSDTDSDTYIEMTLFKAIDESELVAGAVPSYEEVSIENNLRKVLAEAPVHIVEMWREAMKPVN